jgi:hypothetical protein
MGARYYFYFGKLFRQHYAGDRRKSHCWFAFSQATASAEVLTHVSACVVTKPSGKKSKRSSITARRNRGRDSVAGKARSAILSDRISSRRLVQIEMPKNESVRAKLVHGHYV